MEIVCFDRNDRRRLLVDGALVNIRDLEYFLAVAELEHFGRAAKQCHVSQPTLSGQIKKLEEDLGVTLFERTNRKVMLTEVGDNIAKCAQRVMLEIETIHEIAESAHDTMAGKFRLGAFPTLATYVFPALVSKAKEVMPKIRLILIEEKTDVLFNKLSIGEIDAALLALPLRESSLVSEKLFEDEFYLAVPEDHELTKHDIVSQKVLRHHRLLLLEEGHCLRDQALEVCNLHGIAEEQDFKATGLETLRQMVKAGTGITFMPKIAINEDDSGIHYIPFKAPAPKRTIGLVWRKTTPRQLVMDKLIKIFKIQFTN